MEIFIIRVGIDTLLCLEKTHDDALFEKQRKNTIYMLTCTNAYF